jgi:hypothetical protein
MPNENRSDRLFEALRLYVDAQTNAIEVLRQALGNSDRTQLPPKGLTEDVFSILKWESGKGSKLGDFEAAYKTQNMPDNWQHAYNTLIANRATIKNHFSPEGFTHYYWLYPEKYTDRVFRKNRDEAQK